MKAIFITFDQAHNEAVLDVLEKNSCRGFTSFGEIQGRGTFKGEPHFGSHAWPSLGNAIISVVEDDKVKPVLQGLKNLDETKPRLGLRAFVWDVLESI